MGSHAPTTYHYVGMSLTLFLYIIPTLLAKESHFLIFSNPTDCSLSRKMIFPSIMILSIYFSKYEYVRRIKLNFNVRPYSGINTGFLLFRSVTIKAIYSDVQKTNNEKSHVSEFMIQRQ
ncbi:MAG: hypothetical protein RL613_689 [Fusobacteriota bacterium]|jgi:hypothetical protein